MFYFLLAPVIIYSRILIIAAVIPAAVLMIKVYNSDRLEKESPQMLSSLVVAGVLSTLIALIEERVLSVVLSALVEENTTLYNVILYFGIVAFSEESSKYIMMKRKTWTSREFNCQYDGVVYAVFVSLGFALWENISYVLNYGVSTAIVRAVTAIPGHACFGVFMGVFYGLARGYALIGKKKLSKAFRVLSIVIPALLHGAYDYIATLGNKGSSLIFTGFVIVLFGISFYMVNRMSKNDRYFNMNRVTDVEWEVVL